MIARWLSCLCLLLELTLAAPAEGDTAGGKGPFVRTLTVYGDRLWVGTFNDGLFVIDAWSTPEGLEHARPVAAPFRMVNDALEVDGALYVAANEGLFVTRDGATFDRVREVDARGVTAVAFDGHSLYATTTSALWRVRVVRGAPSNAVWWKPAGSRSLQGVVAEGDRVWLASEDRGAILFDGKRFTAFDRLAGLPTSWVVAVAADGQGGVFEATLRDGAFHVDAAGKWTPMQGLPSAWTLSIVRGERDVCVGTQDGAACYDSPSATAAFGAPSSRIEGLPDPRVHALLAAHGSLLAGTEAGIAFVTRHREFTVSAQ
ncbi:MAG: hypothetical protein ACLP1X_09835 [Polyangiaceae bacterium]|jgi:ligand-binding sensor domain-containing protein